MTLGEQALAIILAVIGSGHAWNWWTSRGKQKVDLISLAQTISSDIITALKADRDALKEEVHSLRQEVERLQHDIRGLSQHVVSLETLLLEKGITPPPRPERKGK